MSFNPPSTELDRFRRHQLADETQAASAALSQAVEARHPTALALMGAGLLAAQKSEEDVATGCAMVFDAAEAGHPEALELAAALIAQGVLEAQDWDRCLTYLQRAAELGEPRAGAQLAILTSDQDAAGQIRAGSGDAAAFARARAGVDIGEWLRVGPGRIGNHEPLVVTFENFLPPPVCAWLMERARGRITRARVHDVERHELRDSDARSNGCCLFPSLHYDVICGIVRTRISQIARLPIQALEPLAVLHYQPGQSFEPHHDYFDPALAGHAADIATHGQRVATVLCYLNQDFDGGETHFPILELRYRGRPGDAIMFINVDRRGEPDPRSLHAGLATTRGEKWLLSQFVRNQPQPWLARPAPSSY